MQNVMALALLMIGTSAACLAGTTGGAPEIDASSGAAAIALLAGGLLVIRSRRKK
jgi:hypothetical protein